MRTAKTGIPEPAASLPLDWRRLTLHAALIWYLVVMAFEWQSLTSHAVLQSFAMSMVVGALLTLNAIAPGHHLRDLTPRQVLRFFIIPFCVSSFSTATSGTYWIIFSPDRDVNALAIGAVLLILGPWIVLRRLRAANATPLE